MPELLAPVSPGELLDKIKKRINLALGATLVEEKSYRQYR